MVPGSTDMELLPALIAQLQVKEEVEAAVGLCWLLVTTELQVMAQCR